MPTYRGILGLILKKIPGDAPRVRPLGGGGAYHLQTPSNGLSYMYLYLHATPIITWDDYLLDYDSNFFPVLALCRSGGKGCWPPCHTIHHRRFTAIGTYRREIQRRMQSRLSRLPSLHTVVTTPLHAIGHQRL